MFTMLNGPQQSPMCTMGGLMNGSSSTQQNAGLGLHLQCSSNSNIMAASSNSLCSSNSGGSNTIINLNSSNSNLHALRHQIGLQHDSANKNNNNNSMILVDDFEPLPRDRCNTWPLQKLSGDLGHHTSPVMHEGIPEEELEDEDLLDGSEENVSSNDGSTSYYGGTMPAGTLPNGGGQARPADYYGLGTATPNLDGLCDPNTLNISPHSQNQSTSPNGGGSSGGSSSSKKNTSRRNAWGNTSYAELITQAIDSSQEKRLTLAQIYDWFSNNVPHFRDKGDSNSSAGWKNSIRHNLSLHNRFVRVQNEGAGKSSWWTLNPDAKQGKSQRRRAGSVEQTQVVKFEKKRGRSKRKNESLRASTDGLPSSAAAAAGAAGGSCSSLLGLSSAGSPRGGGDANGSLQPAGSQSALSSTSAATGGDVYDSSQNLSHYGQCTNLLSQSNFNLTCPIMDFRPRSDSNLSEYSICGAGRGQQTRLSPSIAEENDPASCSSSSMFNPASAAAVIDDWSTTTASSDYGNGGGQPGTESQDSSVIGGHCRRLPSVSGYPDLVDSLSQSMKLGSGTGRTSDDKSPLNPVMNSHMSIPLDLVPPPPSYQHRPGNGAPISYQDQQSLLTNGDRLSPDSDQCGQQVPRYSPGHRIVGHVHNNTNNNSASNKPRAALSNGHAPDPSSGPSGGLLTAVKQEPPPVYQELFPPVQNGGGKSFTIGQSSCSSGAGPSGVAACSGQSRSTTSAASVASSTPLLRGVLQNKIFHNQQQQQLKSSLQSRDTPYLSGFMNLSSTPPLSCPLTNQSRGATTLPTSASFASLSSFPGSNVCCQPLVYPHPQLNVANHTGGRFYCGVGNPGAAAASCSLTAASALWYGAATAAQGGPHYFPPHSLPMELSDIQYDQSCQDLRCDIEQVLDHEYAIEGNLDFSGLKNGL